MKKLIFLMMFLAVSSVAFAEKTPDQWDGNDWMQWAEGVKAVYTEGFLTGANFVAASLASDDLDPKKDKSLVLYFGGMTYQQVLDGLNTFYVDIENRRIPLQFGFYIVKKKIEGASKDDYDRMLSYYRKRKY
jgi:hypothetical protein